MQHDNDNNRGDFVRKVIAVVIICFFVITWLLALVNLPVKEAISSISITFPIILPVIIYLFQKKSG